MTTIAPVDDPTKPKKVPGPIVTDPNLAGGGGAVPFDAPAPLPPIGTPAAAPAPAAPTPAAPKPGADWVPTADGLGWLPPNQAGSAAAWHAPAAAAPAAPAPAAPAAPVAPAGGVPGPISTDPAAPAANTAYQDALMKLLNEGGKTASLDDPALKAQADAFSVGQTRATERARGDMAERAAAQGGAGTSSGAFDNELVGLQERQGEAESANNAGLVGDAAKQNLQKLTTALSMMGADKNSEAGRALQAKIADTQAQIQREELAQKGSQFGQSLGEQGRQFDIDAELKRLGIDTNADLGGRDLSLRDKLGSGSLMNQYLATLIGNSNFKDNLGANIGMFNQKSLMEILGL